jgi:tRNA (pseudouridine54-N1)-methyltransferase
MRRFVVMGRSAIASGDFLLDDVPGTSGRLDVGLRCLRAGLLRSHGIRPDAVVYLVLGGGPRAPRALRVRGADAQFLRPDERSLAVLVQKSLRAGVADSPEFTAVRPGVAIASGGLDVVLADIGPAALYVLQAGAADLRAEPALSGGAAFFLGDPTGFDDETRARLGDLGARPVGVGPVDLHTEDVIAIVHNELDRREAGS